MFSLIQRLRVDETVIEWILNNKNTPEHIQQEEGRAGSAGGGVGGVLVDLPPLRVVKVRKRKCPYDPRQHAESAP